MLRLPVAAGGREVTVMWRTRTLASQILLGVLAIQLITTALGALLYITLSGRMLDQQYEERALAIAGTVARMPGIPAALADGDPGGTIQTEAEAVRHGTDASYIVVTDRTGLRYSH